MKKLIAHIKHILSLIATSRKSGLSLGDITRVLIADYSGRVGAGGKTFTISVNGSRIAIRSNPVDHRIALEVLGGIYAVEPTAPATRILDLGANIGASAIYFQRRFPAAQIACVEPSPGNLPMLERNSRLNALSVTIFDCAVGTESGTTTFFDTADPSCCTLLPGNRNNATGVNVSLITVPEIMACMGWDHIDVLKIDIEGYEKYLFADAPEWLSHVSAIVGEIHEGYGIAQLRHDLAPFGFDVSICSTPNEYGQSIFSAVAQPIQLEKNTPVPMMTAGPVR